MKNIAYILVLMAVGGFAHANVEYILGPEYIDVSGKGRYGDEYKLRAEIYQGEGVTALYRLELTHLENRFSSSKEPLVDIVNPDFAGILVLNDSGIFGSHYSFELPYGEKLACGKKMRLIIRQPFDKDKALLKITKLDPCSNS